MGCRKLIYDHFSPTLKVAYSNYGRKKTQCTSKYQWDLIHDPQTMLFAWAQDEEEGALKGVTAQDEVIHVIEKIRCAYKTNRKLKFEKDTWKWFTETVTVTDFNKLYDGVTYDYIFIELQEDVEQLSLPATIQFEEDDNVLAEVFRGEVVTFSFPPLYIKVDKEHAQDLSNYFQPNDVDFLAQKQKFIDKLLEKYYAKEYSRQGVVDILSVSSQCLFECLRKEHRVAFLELINNDKNIPEETERIVIDIIRTTPNNQIKYLLENLYSKGLMAYCDKVVNDVGGEDYYTRLILELLQLYTKEYFSDLENCFTTTEWGDIFIKVTTEQFAFGNLSYVTQNPIPFYEWKKGCDVPTWRYGEKGLELDNSITCGYYNDAKPIVNPFEPVVVYIAEDLPFFNLGDNFEDRVIAMPAFVLSWLRYKALARSGAELLDNSVTIVTSCLTLGQGGLVAKGVPKLLLTAWNYFIKIDAAMKLLLVNDDIEKAIRNIGANGEGDKFLNTYKKYSPYFGYIGKPSIEGLLFKQKVDDLILGYANMGTYWDIIKTSDEVKKALTEGQINEITTNIESVIKTLSNEEIVE